MPVREQNGMQYLSTADGPTPTRGAVRDLIRHRDGKHVGTLRIGAPDGVKLRDDTTGELVPVPGQMPCLTVVIAARGEQISWFQIPLREILGDELGATLRLLAEWDTRPRQR